MTPPKPVEWAKVERDGFGVGYHDYCISILSDKLKYRGTPTIRGDEAHLMEVAGRINKHLSPLLSRVALLDRAVEAIKHVDKLPSPVSKGYSEWKEMIFILTSYASLPKIPEQGKQKGESQNA